MTSTIGKYWQKALQKYGYQHHISFISEVKKLKGFSRVFRRIFKIIKLNPFIKPGSVFEVGCGGGIHLVQFALNGWKSEGIDVSEDVLKRAQNFIDEIEKITNTSLKIKLLQGDFSEYSPAQIGKFDLVYQVGVLEHFLDDNERQMALQKMFALTEPGGYVVCIVPSGMHPWRQMMKEQRLGGYNIPEIDYTGQLMRKEMLACGAKQVIVLPHNLGGYLRLKQNPLYKLLYYCLQIISINYIPQTVAFRHSSTIIGIGSK